MLRHISLKELRPQLPQVIEDVDATMGRYVISKRGEPVAVLLSYDDYESILETLDEVSDVENMRQIRKALKNAKVGNTLDWQTVKRKLKLA